MSRLTAIRPISASGWRTVVSPGETAPGLPLYVTENGCAAEDYVNPEGRVEDLERVDYLHSHLEAAWRACRDGIPLAGYFHWSLLHNFEWAWGYQKRFGLVFVEFETQRRIPRRSAAYYAGVAAANALPSTATGDAAQSPLIGGRSPPAAR